MATPSLAAYPSLTLAFYPSLSQEQFEQVAGDLTKKQGLRPRLMVVGTQESTGPIPPPYVGDNPPYQAPAPAMLVGIWKNQTDPGWFLGSLAPALKAAGVPDSKVPWSTHQIHVPLKETMLAGKPYERVAEPRPMLLIDADPDQTPEQFDSIMKHLAKRGPGPRGGRQRHVEAAAGLPSGAQLMVVGGPPAPRGLDASPWRKVDGPGRIAISVWQSEKDADQFVGDLEAASQEVGVSPSDKGWLAKSTIHSLMRP
jgi:hypothetical protein